MSSSPVDPRAGDATPAPGGSPPITRRRRRARPRPPADRTSRAPRAEPLGRPISFATGAWAVLVTEFRGLLRDRRALFSAFVLPTLLYPLLFLGNSWLERVSQETLSSRHVRVAHDLSAMPADQAARLVELLRQETPVDVQAVRAEALLALGENLDTGATVTAEERAAVSKLLPETGDLLVLARPLSGVPRYALRTYYDGQTDLGNEADRRARHALSTFERETSAARLVQVLGQDPARGLAAHPIDVADEREKSGATLGRYLPLIAIFVLLAGASYAALSGFAGEREGGTLETLLVQPIHARSVVTGKFAAVLATALVTLALNAGSVLVSLKLGLGNLPGARFENGLVLDGGRLLGASILYLPATVFLCAVLCLVCGRARTFREGQQLLLPLLLLAVLPALPATQPEIRLDALLAAVPLCGPSLALRDALRGEVALGLWAWMFVAQSLWAALALSRLSRLLDAERILQGAENEAEQDARSVQSRLATRWAIVGVFAVYLVGATLQKIDVVWGLAATLWLVLLPMALLAAHGTAKRARENLREAMWLRLPNPAHALGALLCAPGLLWVARRLLEWQQNVLPMPSSFEKIELFPAGTEPGAWGMIVLVALSPAICEEMFFRGAVLSGLRRDLPAWKTVLLQVLFFGAVHLSIYRFLPTGLLGGVLAIATLRSRSLVPAMVLHGAYNALGVTNAFGVAEDPRYAWLCVPGILLFALPPRTSRG